MGEGRRKGSCWEREEEMGEGRRKGSCWEREEEMGVAGRGKREVTMNKFEDNRYEQYNK
jgi:hypothetical protein